MKHMRPRIIVAAVLVLAAVIIVAVSCSMRKGDSRATAAEAEGDISIADESELEETEDTGKTSTPVRDDVDTVSEISQEDADNLINEKLAGKICTPVFSEVAAIDGENYYTYTVLDENEEEMEQMLVVNAVSGEVFVYNIEENTIFDFNTIVMFVSYGYINCSVVCNAVCGIGYMTSD